MPSDHSILVWSFAHVVASEYDGWATKVVVYSLATSASAARVIARKHFPFEYSLEVRSATTSVVMWFIAVL